MFFETANLLALEASLLAAFITLVGMISMAAFGNWGQRFSPFISAFAVGVLITSTLFHLLPEGYALSSRIWQWIGLGFVVFLVMDLLLRMVTSGQSLNTDLAFASSSIIALGTHSFLDGILYGMSFQGEVFSGWITVMGLLVHEMPEGIIIYSLLRQTRLPVLTTSIVAFFAACVTTIAGTLATLSFITVASASLPAMMGLTAGAFLYIMIFHLGPHAATAPSRHGYLAASFGVIVSIGTLLLEHLEHHEHTGLVEHHEHHDHTE